MIASAAEQSRRDAAGQPAAQRQLAPVMNRMHQQLAPEQAPNAPQFSIGVADFAFEIGGLQTRDSCRRVVMNDAERGRQRFDRPRAFDVRRLERELELALFDAERRVGIDFGKVPGELARDS